MMDTFVDESGYDFDAHGAQCLALLQAPLFEGAFCDL
jgi:hypothetical protein